MIFSKFTLIFAVVLVSLALNCTAKAVATPGMFLCFNDLSEFSETDKKFIEDFTMEIDSKSQGRFDDLHLSVFCNSLLLNGEVVYSATNEFILSTKAKKIVLSISALGKLRIELISKEKKLNKVREEEFPPPKGTLLYYRKLHDSNHAT